VPIDRDKLLANLREKRAEKKANPTPPAAPIPEYFPLWALLDICHKAKKLPFLNYMEGAELLIERLGPIKLPKIPDDFRPMSIVGGYETRAFADLIAGKNATLSQRDEVKRIVLYTAIKKSLGERHE
jgi:hypothetical protein